MLIFNLDILRKVTKNIFTCALTLCGCFIMLVSCSDSNPLPENRFEVPEGMVKLTLMIPDYDSDKAKFGTKAFDVDEEGYMSNLYVVAVKYYDVDASEDFMSKNPPTKQVYAFALNPVGEKFVIGSDKNNNGQYDDNEFTYRTFNVALYPGKYRFGIVANVDLYLKRATKISEFTEESQLEDIVLNFEEGTPLAPTHLPMVCLPEEIKYRTKFADGRYSEEKKGEGENYLITIGGTQNNNGIEEKIENVICARMKFLCSKVRYTILFDKTPGGISESFGSSWIRFNVDDQLKPFVTNIRQQTQLRTGVSTGEGLYDSANPFIPHYNDESPLGYWTMNINRYKWSNEGADYPRTPSSSLEAWDKSTDLWIPQEKKVWQGVVYLPENTGIIHTENGEKNISKTVLKFPYHTRVNSLDETPEIEASNPKEIWLFGNPNEEKFEGTTDKGDYSSTPGGTFQGLERNFMYDVVAKVVNPDVDDMTIQVFVSILPWHEVDQTIPDEDDLFNQGNNNSPDINTGINEWEYQGSHDAW